MARVQFSAAVTVRCSQKRAFDYFADHRHVAAVLEGVTRWEPIGQETEGVGARYNVEMNALGFPLKNVLRLDRWASPREIGWVSESGLIKQHGGFTFTRVKQGVRIELHLVYVPPAGFLGAAIARELDSTVRHRLRAALEKIRDTLES